MRKKVTYRDKRKKAFEEKIPIGDQLDAILKTFDMILQLDEVELPYELIDIIEEWQTIKAKYPKE